MNEAQATILMKGIVFTRHFKHLHFPIYNIGIHLIASSRVTPRYSQRLFLNHLILQAYILFWITCFQSGLYPPPPMGVKDFYGDYRDSQKAWESFRWSSSRGLFIKKIRYLKIDSGHIYQHKQISNKCLTTSCLTICGHKKVVNLRRKII